MHQTTVAIDKSPSTLSRPTRREDTQSRKASVTLADQLGLVCQRHYHSNADIKWPRGVRVTQTAMRCVTVRPLTGLMRPFAAWLHEVAWRRGDAAQWLRCGVCQFTHFGANGKPVCDFLCVNNVTYLSASTVYLRHLEQFNAITLQHSYASFTRFIVLYKSISNHVILLFCLLCLFIVFFLFLYLSYYCYHCFGE